MQGLGFQKKQIEQIRATGSEERAIVAAELILAKAFVALGQTELIDYSKTGIGKKAAVQEKKEQKEKDKENEEKEMNQWASDKEGKKKGASKKRSAKRADGDEGDKEVIIIDDLEEAAARKKNKEERAAREKAEATKEMRARRGRAAYTGERSVGSYDAGAIAVAVMLERLVDAWDRA